jgi:hypothetical protein
MNFYIWIPFFKGVYETVSAIQNKARAAAIGANIARMSFAA